MTPPVAGSPATVSAASSSEPGFIARLGLAIIAPGWAISVAGDRRNPGRAGSDLMKVILMLLASAHLRGVVVAGWLTLGVSAQLGLRTLSAVFSSALTAPLAFLVIAAAVLWLVAGRARNLGRAFDLASVAAVPLILVLLVGVVVSSAMSWSTHARPMLGFGVLGLAFGWAGAVVSLALATARTRVSVASVPPPAVVRRGRRAGLAILAVVALAFASQAAWVGAHLDDLRPVVASQVAPAFALPAVGADGTLGARVDVTPGGRPKLIEFWATWCGICVRGLPKLDAVRAAHPELDVITVNLDDAAHARRLLRDGGYGLSLLFDDAGVAERYNVASLPHLVLIGADGHVHEVQRGMPRDLEALVREATR